MTSDDAEAIKAYIEKKGFGEPTPPLHDSLSADTFRQHYYNKKELQRFCKSVGISTAGLKNELSGRIELFLKTGIKSTDTTKKSNAQWDSETGLSIDKKVVAYKSDLATREFFKAHIAEFVSFSALVQKWIKERLARGEHFTYGDVIEKHLNFLQNKKNDKLRSKPAKVAHDSCQYNQFLIDYNHHTLPKVHSAKAAWQLVRDSAGDKTFQRYLEKINEIRRQITKRSPSNPTFF